MDKNIIIATRDGMIKRSCLKDFKLQRYSKATSCIKLKDNDTVISALLETEDYVPYHIGTCTKCGETTGEERCTINDEYTECSVCGRPMG